MLDVEHSYKMSSLRSFLVVASVLFSTAYGYVDFGSLTLPVNPQYEPTPRPNQLPEDYDIRFEILPSMITAVAPSVTLAANGTRHTLHSVHFHHYFSRTRQGRGVFDKRGVFASDPPIATCTPCGGGATTYTPPNTTTSTLSCKTETYHVSSSPYSRSSLCTDKKHPGGSLQLTTNHNICTLLQHKLYRRLPTQYFFLQWLAMLLHDSCLLPNKQHVFYKYQHHFLQGFYGGLSVDNHYSQYHFALFIDYTNKHCQRRKFFLNWVARTHFE